MRLHRLLTTLPLALILLAGGARVSTAPAGRQAAVAAAPAKLSDILKPGQLVRGPGWRAP